MPRPMQELDAATIKRQMYVGCIICLIGALFYCYEFILRIIPGALQAELRAAFGHMSASAFGQLSAFYYFAYSPMQLPVGMLMDRFGPRRLLSFACLCCTLGSLMFSYSSSMVIAASGRFLVGFGSSFAFVGVLSLAMHWLPKRYFSLVAGLITTLGMLGLVYGEVKITEMVDHHSLQDILAFMVIVGLILTVIIFLVVRDGPGGIAVKQQALPVFLRNVFSVLKSRQVWLIGFIGACAYTSLSVFGELWGKTYLEQVHHLTKIQAAHTISALFLGWAIGAPISGYLSDYTGLRVLPITLGALLALVCIAIVLYCPGLSYYTLNSLLFFYGVFSSTEIIIFVMAKENSGAVLSGTVFAVTNMLVTLGGVIFQPLVGTLLDVLSDTQFAAGEHVYSVLNYQLALSILPLSLLVVALAAFFINDSTAT
ncbi:MAG: MFS transporter [Legionella sp.]